MADQVDLSVSLGRGLRLRSPVMVASGTFGYGFDAHGADRTALGAIVTKGTTPGAREGNAPTRIAETPSAMLNAIGLQNPGVDHVVRVYAPKWATWDVPVIVNVAGDAVDDYVAVARRLDGVSFGWIRNQEGAIVLRFRGAARKSSLAMALHQRGQVVHGLQGCAAALQY